MSQVPRFKILSEKRPQGQSAHPPSFLSVCVQESLSSCLVYFVGFRITHSALLPFVRMRAWCVIPILPRTSINVSKIETFCPVCGKLVPVLNLEFQSKLFVQQSFSRAHTSKTCALTEIFKPTLTRLFCRSCSSSRSRKRCGGNRRKRRRGDWRSCRNNSRNKPR